MEILTCGNDFHKLRFEPPSDEGGGKTLVLTEGEFSLPQSFALQKPAPSSEGAKG